MGKGKINEDLPLSPRRENSITAKLQAREDRILSRTIKKVSGNNLNSNIYDEVSSSE